MLYTQLRAFHTVAREGSFTAAARALSVSQPTLTTQVRALERAYDVELFHRRGRGVELTGTGREFFAITQRLMSSEQEAVDFLKAVHGLRAGHLKIGAIGPYQASEILSLFQSEYPGIRVSIAFGNSVAVQQEVLNFRVDIGIVGQHQGHPDLYSLEYSNPEGVVVVSSRHPWAKRRGVRIEELAGEHVVRREAGSETRHAFETALKKAGIAPEYIAEVGSKEGVVAAVARNVGIGFVSEEEFIPSPAIHAVRISNSTIRMKVHVICLADRKDSSLIRAFLGVAQEIAPGKRGRTFDVRAPASRG